MSSVAYRIRRSARARHARLVVDAGGVELVLPRGVAVEDVQGWVKSRRPWVERTLERYRQAAEELPAIEVADGGALPYLGAALLLRVKVDPVRRRSHVRRSGKVLTAKVASPEDLEPAVERWYRLRAHEEIEPRLHAATRRAGRSYKRLTVRAQRTRWGSCSSSGTMSFNWRLLLAPEAVLDYVIEHEVAHLDVPDHSPRFWALLAERCPDHREHERWLKRYGSALRLG